MKTTGVWVKSTVQIQSQVFFLCVYINADKKKLSLALKIDLKESILIFDLKGLR